MRGTKLGCSDRMVVFREKSVRRGLTEFAAHYRVKRNNQRNGNNIVNLEVGVERAHGDVQRRERLGGMLHHLSDASPVAHEVADAWLTPAEQTLHSTGFFARLPDLLGLCAELARQRGDAPGRVTALREALHVYQKKGALPHAERIERELAS